MMRRPSRAGTMAPSTGAPRGAGDGHDCGPPPRRALGRSTARSGSSRDRSAGTGRSGAGGTGWSRRSWNAAKSCGRESITSRGILAPRPIVRPSAAFDRELGAPPGCGGRRPSHPGAEAVLLGAVALLGLVGLLHRDCPGSSPSGLGDGLSLTPEGTQTRLAPESARRVVVRRMIGPARRRVSNDRRSPPAIPGIGAQARGWPWARRQQASTLHDTP